MRKILIATTGYVPAYREVTYVFEGETYSSWMSSNALIHFLFPKPEELDVILIYPDNPMAKKGVTDGFKAGENGLTENREAIVDLFTQCRSIHKVTVEDSKYISEQDMMKSFTELDSVIRGIAQDDEVEITYDLTHSYRHLAFIVLLQSMYLQALSRGKVDVRRIFYAFAKQPLKVGDEVRYLDLTEIFKNVLNTQIIKTAVEELRPYPLRNYADSLAKLERTYFLPENLDNTYIRNAKKKINRISDFLQKLQNGFFELETLDELENTVSNLPEPKHQWDKFLHKFISALAEEVRGVLASYKVNGQFKKKYLIMTDLSELVFNRQADVGRAFAFLRESQVEFIRQILNTNVEQADRLFSFIINPDHSKKAPPDIRRNLDVFANVGRWRNELLHLGMGKEVARIKTYEGNFEKTLPKVRRAYSDDSFVKYISQSEDLIEK